MAENMTKPLGTEPETLADGTTTYEGNFIGDLQGNADTASRLKNGFTITLAGDAAGNVTTDGSSQTLKVDVVYADRAGDADHASTADTVTQAQTALSANYATTAGHATSADSATNAVNASVAKAAGHADSASSAVNAQEAVHALTADKATEADSAKTAQRADVAGQAESLPADYSVPLADYAHKAGWATQAAYDCEGYAFHLTYAKKNEVVLKEDAFTLEDAQSLFMPISARILQATVYGKACGYGTVLGNTLQIHISKIATPDGDGAFYYDLALGKPTANADTTKVYLDENGYLYLWIDEKKAWQQVNAPLPSDVQTQLSEAVGKLNDVVTLSTDQEIVGNKSFRGLVKVGIPVIDEDSGRAAATVHNLRDMRNQYRADYLEAKAWLQTEIQNINARLDRQDKGNILFGYKDYSIVDNQIDMVPGTRYINYLTKEGEYIQLNPATDLPEDPEQVPYWRRIFVKDSNGRVTYFTDAIDVDLTGYAKLTGATFTGNVQVPDVPLETDDNTVLNSRVTRDLIEQYLNQYNDELNPDEFARLTGADFTGNVTVPAKLMPTEAGDNDVLGKGDIIKLIDDRSPTIINLAAYPEEADLQKVNTLYAYPSPLLANCHASEIISVNVRENEVADVMAVSERELAAFGAGDLL